MENREILAAAGNQIPLQSNPPVSRVFTAKNINMSTYQCPFRVCVYRYMAQLKCNMLLTKLETKLKVYSRLVEVKAKFGINLVE